LPRNAAPSRDRPPARARRSEHRVGHGGARRHRPLWRTARANRRDRIGTEALDLALTAVTPRDVVSTYRTTALYRYRSDRREHTVPVLLAFALINRPDVFDLRPCDSFVEQLLDEGFDVYPRDWGVPDDEDADRGLDRYVCNELAGASSRRCSSGQDEIALLGWWIGATVCAMHCALGNRAVRNLVLLTAPVGTRGSLYALWIGHDEFAKKTDVRRIFHHRQRRVRCRDRHDHHRLALIGARMTRRLKRSAQVVEDLLPEKGPKLPKNVEKYDGQQVDTAPEPRPPRTSTRRCTAAWDLSLSQAAACSGRKLSETWSYRLGLALLSCRSSALGLIRRPEACRPPRTARA
jgi:hypothetical protein